MRFACLLAFTFGLIQASARPSADGRTPAGRMTDIIERVEGAGTTWHYTYDAAGQLQTVHEGADLRESFTYDFNGNLQVVGAMASPEVDRRDRLLSFEGDEFVVGYGYNDLGQRTMACKVTCEGVAPWKLWEYTYDALGSLLQAVQFSAANEDVEVGGVEYLIGPGGQRFGRRTWTLAPAHPTPGATGSTSTPSTPAPMVGCTYIIDWDAGPRTPVATYRTVWGQHDQLDTVNLWLDGNGEVVKRVAVTPGEAPDPDDRWLYDAAGRLLAMKAYGQAERHWTYGEGRLVQSSVVGHGNQTTVWAYPGAGVEVIHPGGIVEESVHGWLGAVASRTVTVAGSEELSTLHDHLGRVVSRTTPGVEWVYGHNALGLATAESPAGLWTYTRRADGQLLAVNAPAGPDREYAYDGLGRPLEATVHNGGLVQTLEVGWNGNIPTYSQLGVQRTVHPDGRGRPVHTTWTRNAPPDGDLLSRSIRYDIGDRPLSVDETFEGLATPVVSAYAWDAAGRLVTATEAGGAIGYAYTDAHSVTVTPPWGATPLTRTFDDLGRLTSVTRGLVGHTLSWDAGGRLTGISGGGLSQTRAYAGPGNRLSSISFFDGTPAEGDPLGSLTYAWNPDQARGGLAEAPWLTLTDTVAGANRVTEHWLDAAERLSRVIQPDTNGRRQHDYTWRADGARTAETITDPDDTDDEDCGENDPCTVAGEASVDGFCRSLETRIAHEFDGLGQLTSIERFTRRRQVGNQGWQAEPGSLVDVQSDGWGRITSYQTDGFARQMAWDVEGRMLSLDDGIDTYQYRYNHRDQRLTRAGPGGDTVHSAWEADGLLAERFDGPDPDVVRTHLRGAGMVLGVDETAFGLDHLGSPVLRWTGAATTTRFDAWGAQLGGNVPEFGDESVGYTGHASDHESKLTYAQARYYDPSIGNFLSPDPWSGSLEHPGTLQKYAYVLGNPLQYTDPDGRNPEHGGTGYPGDGTEDERILEDCGGYQECVSEVARVRARRGGQWTDAHQSIYRDAAALRAGDVSPADLGDTAHGHAARSAAHYWGFEVSPPNRLDLRQDIGWYNIPAHILASAHGIFAMDDELQRDICLIDVQARLGDPVGVQISESRVNMFTCKMGFIAMGSVDLVPAGQGTARVAASAVEKKLLQQAASGAWRRVDSWAEGVLSRRAQWKAEGVQLRFSGGDPEGLIARVIRGFTAPEGGGRGYVSGFREIREKVRLAKTGTAAKYRQAVAEIRAAKHLRAQGRDVHFQTPGTVRSAEGGTADFLVDGARGTGAGGTPFDVVAPTSGRPDAVFRAVRNKNNQARVIVLDLSNTTVTADQLGNIMGRLRGSGATNIQEVIVLP